MSEEWSNPWREVKSRFRQGPPWCEDLVDWFLADVKESFRQEITVDRGFVMPWCRWPDVKARKGQD